MRCSTLISAIESPMPLADFAGRRGWGYDGVLPFAPEMEGFYIPSVEQIVAAVRAEREGAVAVVCAPIVSSVIEQLVHIPVATIIPRESVQRAIELAARKAWL